MSFASIPELLDELRAGRMVVIVDDEDRENEGDLIMPAELVRPAHAKVNLWLNVVGRRDDAALPERDPVRVLDRLADDIARDLVEMDAHPILILIRLGAQHAERRTRGRDRRLRTPGCRPVRSPASRS